jgi:hypothetical protein
VKNHLRCEMCVQLFGVDLMRGDVVEMCPCLRLPHDGEMSFSYIGELSIEFCMSLEYGTRNDRA